MNASYSMYYYSYKQRPETELICCDFKFTRSSFQFQWKLENCSIARKTPQERLLGIEAAAVACDAFICQLCGPAHLVSTRGRQCCPAMEVLNFEELRTLAWPTESGEIPRWGYKQLEAIQVNEEFLANLIPEIEDHLTNGMEGLPPLFNNLRFQDLVFTYFKHSKSRSLLRDCLQSIKKPLQNTADDGREVSINSFNLIELDTPTSSVFDVSDGPENLITDAEDSAGELRSRTIVGESNKSETQKSPEHLKDALQQIMQLSRCNDDLEILDDLKAPEISSWNGRDVDNQLNLAMRRHIQRMRVFIAELLYMCCARAPMPQDWKLLFAELNPARNTKWNAIWILFQRYNTSRRFELWNLFELLPDWAISPSQAIGLGLGQNKPLEKWKDLTLQQRCYEIAI
eukprot:Gregarina_sp_Poly_1__907@NODE_1218_length_4748_cov_13_433027_g831_i0_p2_GENE_NODE_1218_length_4748_cov_13_433027_g831_i0NODE_1218_length_4748_cov_13_433027_g831_i0_p2_ORF_typecomplete_len400_score43_95AAA_lid_6/PF17866_1/0_24zfCCCH_6/PF18585_1/0_91_NODE_1218_length_4748_cov_13_433027_g831_i034734672